ncbi:MFS multidrug transporter [Hyaloscypha variabilis]|uniref:MFS multidrug transporter n=1 Tax=Hyaloscypha variabilis (strain UAMH 11265 / GT02V1 / F) TaxID=1149755 RepID=A0A2J6RG37_HYAVF|nr:MFS multidrug transporter [Hyaloscypha variabilis F]
MARELDDKATGISSSADEAHIENALGSNAITSDHEAYILQRHGTLDLIPMPSSDPADPLNWPSWKKNLNLALIAFHGLMSTGCAVAVVPAFQTFSRLYHTTLTNASYLGSAQLITLALGPILWVPIANRYGRRPIWLISVIGAGLFNMGCALSQSYGANMACRVMSAFFISPGIAMGQAVVAETFFAHQRASKMGIWALAITLGPPMGPFAAGFIIQHLGWRWMYWVMAILNLGQFVTYLFFGPETLYHRASIVVRFPADSSVLYRQYLRIGRIMPAPLGIKDFVLPFVLLGDPRVLLTVISYSIVFNFVLVLLTVEIPVYFGVLFHLNPQQIGINFLGLLIGCVLGELIGGPLSDFWRNQWIRRTGGKAFAPEQRLWLAYLGYPLSIAGVVIFCVTLAEAKPLHWIITPIVGIAVAGFGTQIITTIVVTYCSDCHPEIKSSAIGVSINFVRCTWGFLGPFWFPHMFGTLGLRRAAALVSCLMIFASLLIVYIHWKYTRMGAAKS